MIDIPGRLVKSIEADRDRWRALAEELEKRLREEHDPQECGGDHPSFVCPVCDALARLDAAKGGDRE